MPCDRGCAALLLFGLLLLPAPQKAAGQSESTDRQPLSPNPIDRWNRMPPEERERELAKLPPARARRIRQRIWAYNHMRPEEKQALQERYQSFSRLPPEKQQIVRQRLREASQLPRPRQKELNREVQQLRMLPEPQRLARINSPEFRNRFSPQEQQIIRDLSTYIPN